MEVTHTVGIDVALREHRVAVLDRDGESVGKSFSIEGSLDGFERLVATLTERGARPACTVIGLEATGHLWENLEGYLRNAGYSVVLLNPLQTARYHEVLRKKAKTDDVDAYVIAGLIRSGEAVASYVPDEQIQGLRELARLHARLLEEKQGYLRQLGAQLDVALPEHRELFGDLLGNRARGVLREFPTAYHLVNAAPKAVFKAGRDAGARWTMQDAVELCERVKRSAYSGKAAAVRGTVVRTLVAQIDRLEAAIAEVKKTMSDTLDTFGSDDGGPTDAELWLSLPGVGAQTAAVLLGELGPLRRFRDARALVAYVGYIPIIRESGERAERPRLSPAGPHVARHALYMAAVNAVRRCAEFRAIYVRKKAQGKAAKQALIAVAVKLLHTAFALFKQRVLFNPARLLVAPLSA